jgi:hypothetical protein
MSNVPVDPSQLPVEVALDPPISLTTLITLAGFEQLGPIFEAVALLILNFKLGGRRLTHAEHVQLLRTVDEMRQTINQMRHKNED